MVDWWLRIGIAPGILVGFSLYLVGVEEIHWRVHLGGWFPGMVWIREYHMAHHDIPDGRYNVFFPVFDLLLGNMKPPLESTQAAAMARSVPSCEPNENAFVAAATQAVLCVWLVGMTIGVRYFWTTKTKL